MPQVIHSISQFMIGFWCLQAAQIRRNKKEQLLSKRRNKGGSSGAPVLIVSLFLCFVLDEQP